MQQSEEFLPLFKKYIEDTGLTEEAFGVRVGVVKSTVSRWKSGNLPVSADNLQRCCDVLGLTRDQRVDLFVLRGFLSLPPGERILPIYETQEEANAAIIARIEARSDLKNAQLVQYSSQYVLAVISALTKKTDVHIELFLQHPEGAIDRSQIRKICGNIDNLLNVARNLLEKEKRRLTIILYKDTATIRAVRLDDEIFIGYYTYETEESEHNKVHGHDNFVVHVTKDNPKSRSIIQQFEETCQAYRSWSETVLEDFTWCDKNFPVGVKRGRARKT